MNAWVEFLLCYLAALRIVRQASRFSRHLCTFYLIYRYNCVRVTLKLITVTLYLKEQLISIVCDNETRNEFIYYRRM